MAIAYDTVTNAGLWNGSQSSVTWSHTCSGTDRALVVFVNPWQNSCSGVTYNGVAMTQIGTYVTVGGWKGYAFYLKNPASGANNVVVTLNTSTYVRCGALSFTGADQTTQPDTYTTGSGSNSITTTVTATTDCYLVAGIFAPNTGSQTAGTGTTQVGSMDEHLTTMISSTARGSGSQSLNWTASVYSLAYYHVALRAAAGGSSTQISSINGVAQASISSFNGVALASIASAMGVSNS